MFVGAEEGPSLDVVDGMSVGAEEGTKLGVTEGLLVGLEKGAEVGLSVTTNISERRTPAAKQLLIASRLAEDSKTNAVEFTGDPSSRKCSSLLEPYVLLYFLHAVYVG